MTYLELKNTLLISIIFTLRMLGIFMILPIMTTYGIYLKNSNELLIGISIGIYGITQILFQIPFGVASDKIGRKPVILTGLLIFLIGSAIAAISDNIWGVIIGRGLQGTSAITAPLIALLSDIVQTQNLTKAMAIIGASFSITFSSSIVLGPIIVYYIGLQGVFWIISLLTLINIIIIILFPKISPIKNQKKIYSSIKNNIYKIITNLYLLKINFSIFCLQTILILNFSILPKTMILINIFPENQWKIYLIVMITSLILAMVIIMYFESQGLLNQLLIICIMAIICAEFLLSKTTLINIWSLYFGLELFFTTFNILEVMLPSLINKAIEKDCKGTAISIYTTHQFFGITFGGILGGWILQYTKHEMISLINISIAIIWLIIILIINYYSLNKKITN